MHQFKNVGLDSRGFSPNSLHNRVSPAVRGIDFDSQYEVQQGGRAAFSKINIESFVQRATGGSVLGTFNVSTALNLTSEITFLSPNADKPTFGRPILAVYQGAGTASVDQIYPLRGANVSLGRYDVQGGVADFSNYNGTADQVRFLIVDSNGTSNQDITFVADWIFLDYARDTVE